MEAKALIPSQRIACRESERTSTTAASVWVTAALGAPYGLAAWKLLVVAIARVLFLPLAGGSIEKWCQKALGIEEKAGPPGSR